jgi:hypothetical protein
MGLFDFFGSKSKPSKSQTLIVFDWDSIRGKQLNYDFIKKSESPVVWVITRQESPERYSDLAAYPIVTKVTPPYERSLRVFLANSLVYEVTTNAVYKKIILIGEGEHYNGTVRFLKEKGYLVDLINAEDLVSLKPIPRSDNRRQTELQERKNLDNKQARRTERREEVKPPPLEAMQSKVREYAAQPPPSQLPTDSRRMDTSKVSKHLEEKEKKEDKKISERRVESASEKIETKANQDNRGIERPSRKPGAEAKKPAQSRELPKHESPSAQKTNYETQDTSVIYNPNPQSSKENPLASSKEHPKIEVKTGKGSGKVNSGAEKQGSFNKEEPVENLSTNKPLAEKKTSENSRSTSTSKGEENIQKAEKSSNSPQLKVHYELKEKTRENQPQSDKNKNEVIGRGQGRASLEERDSEKKSPMEVGKRNRNEPVHDKVEKADRAEKAKVHNEISSLPAIDDAKLIVDYFHNNFIIDETYKKSFLGMVVKQATGKNIQDVFGVKNAKHFINMLIAKDCLVEVDSQHYLVKAYPTIDTIIQIGRTIAGSSQPGSNTN